MLDPVPEPFNDVSETLKFIIHFLELLLQTLMRGFFLRESSFKAGDIRKNLIESVFKTFF